MSKQPRDDGNDPIPVLGFRTHSGHQVPFTSSTSNTSPSISNSVRVVTLYSTAECFVETHISASIEANKVNSHFIPATVPYDISLRLCLNAWTALHLLRDGMEQRMCV